MNGRTAKLLNKVVARACPEGIEPGVRNRMLKKLKRDWYESDKNTRARLRRRFQHWLLVRESV